MVGKAWRVILVIGYFSSKLTFFIAEQIADRLDSLSTPGVSSSEMPAGISGLLVLVLLCGGTAGGCGILDISDRL